MRFHGSARLRQSVYISSVFARFALLAALLLLLKLTPVSMHISQWVAAGDRAAEQGESGAALVTYDRAMARLDSSPVIYERLVSLSLKAGNYAQARAYLYALAEVDGWNGIRRDQLETIWRQGGDTVQADTLLHASLTQDQLDPVALYSLAREQISYGNWDAARNTLARLVVLRPDNAEALYLLGNLVAPEDRLLAVDYLSRAAADPAWTVRAQTVLTALGRYQTETMTDAHTFLGVTLLGLGEWTLAERALVFALEANAVNPAALAYLGFARDQQGRDGLPDIEAALAMAPNDPQVYYVLGQHWSLVGDDEAAYEAFNQAYWLDTDNPALAAEVGTALKMLGDLAGAEEWLCVAVDLAPADARWYGLLAAFYADTGFQLDVGGHAFIEEAAELAPDDPDVQASLGWSFYQLGQYDRAYETLSRAISLDAGLPRARYYWGVVLEYFGDRAGAADAYWFVVGQVGSDSGFGLLAMRGLQRLGYLAAD
jgi:tetratricopeptide (TPR) repeat protein